MPKYNVTMPLVGSIVVTVEADTPKAAIEAALDSELFGDLETVGGAEILELNAMRKITSGNVLHASLNEAFADLAE